MPELTPELNLVVAEDDDDTADYLVMTEGLAGSLAILDGLFSAATGHAHNGAHQGGQLQFQDLVVGEDLLVEGTLVVEDTTTLQSVLNVGGKATLHSLDVTTTSLLRGAVTMSVGLNVIGAATLGATLGVTGLATLGSLDVTGTSRLRGAVTIDGTINGGTFTTSTLTVGGNATVGGTLGVTGALSATSISASGNVAGGTVYSRGQRVWDAADFSFGVAPNPSTLVQRNGSGYISANYISMTADIAAGKPTYVVGQNGDGYLRYWPASAIGPPANVDASNYYRETAISGSWSTTDGSPGVTWSLTLPIAGHWKISIDAYITATAIGGGANGYVDVQATGPIADSPTQYFRWGSTDQSVRGGYGKSAHGVYAANVVQTWRIPGSWRTASGSVTGKIVAHFVPSSDYPG